MTELRADGSLHKFAPVWAPPVGAIVRGDSPTLAYMFSIGASRYFLPADADSAEVAKAFSEATHGFEATPTPERTIRLAEPSKALMRCIAAIQVGSSMIAVGSLADANDQFVKRFPSRWEPAPSGYTDLLVAEITASRRAP